MLRELKLEDALYMLEWMHDINVTAGLAKNFSEMTIKDCQKFIENSWSDHDNLHLAVVDRLNSYMGTISLKNINIKKGWAEFAIAMRTKAIGNGLAGTAIHEMINIGWSKLKLTNIYWNVLKTNKRAIRFYDKNGFRRVSESMIDKILLTGGGTAKIKSIYFGGITFPTINFKVSSVCQNNIL